MTSSKRSVWLTFRSWGFLSLSGGLLLSGCGINAVQQAAVDGTLAMNGRVYGGSQPISGATIQLYAAGTSGYGSASTALLTQSVQSDSGGNFRLTGLYSCPSASTQVYLTATQGNPGLAAGTNNAQIAEVVALGPCGNLSASTTIIINELTTVAAVWALEPFMTAFDHVGTSPTNVVGLANAFTMAGVLANGSSGRSPGSAPAGSTVPTAELDTLANVIASCVNTTGGVAGDGTVCGNLFVSAAPSGGPAPTDTVSAAHNIAAHPSSNVGNIYALAGPIGPFQPSLSSEPNDWTVAVNFATGAATTADMAIDVVGDVWVSSSASLYELSPAGSLLRTFPAMGGTRVALDATGNIWVGSGANNAMTLRVMPPSLSAPAVYTHAAVGSSGGYNFSGLALDGFGNAWYTCDYCGSISKTDASGNYVGSYTATASQHSNNVSIDQNENAWLGNFDYAKVNVFTNGGVLAGSAPYGCGTCGYPSFVAHDGSGNAWMTGYNLTRMTPSGVFTNYASDPVANGGLFSPAAVAIDGAGNAWVANSTASNASAGSLTQFTNSGTPLSPSLGYISSTLSTPSTLSTDGSGNVWLLNSGDSSVTVFVGAAVPVVTPLALGVKNGTLGSKP